MENKVKGMHNHSTNNGRFKKGSIPANKVDLTGQRFGMLVVIERIKPTRLGERTKYLCHCDCGQDKIISGDKLPSGHTKSCGCLKHRIKNIKGQRFGRAVAVEHVGFNKHGSALWLCKCDCGVEFKAPVNGLTSGQNKSCGCLRIDRLRDWHKENREDLTGNRYGRWVVLKLSKKYTAKELRSKGGFMWECKCDCGTIKEVHSGSLKRGATLSCGCVNHVLPPGEYSQIKTENEKRRAYCKYLTDSYVRGSLKATGYLKDEITPEMVITKRLQIIESRLLKQSEALQAKHKIKLKEKAKIRHRKWCEQNKEHVNKTARERAYNKLYPGAIRWHLLRTYSEVSDEMVEMVRQRRLMKRTLKQFKEWREENESDSADVQG